MTHTLNNLKEYLRGRIGIAVEIILTVLFLRICLRPVSDFGELPCLYPPEEWQANFPQAQNNL
jgi:hypothetical protein